VVTRSGSPVGAGIAGSSALNVAVCAALAAWQGQDWPPERLLARAMNIEAQAIDVPTGAQDYRPAMYGGVAAIELDVDGIRRVPLPVPPAELEERIVLAYTGESRQSGINNWEITKRHIDGDRAVFDLFEQIRDTAVSMRQALVRGDWPEVGRQIGAEWSLRRQLAPGVSTPAIDALILHAARAGARAANVCGAGGCGCVLFLADPDRTAAVRRAIAEAGTRLLDCRIDTDGLRIAHSESA